MKPSIFLFLFVAAIAAAQRKLPDSVQQMPKPVQKAPQPAADRFQRFRYRMAFPGQGAYLAGFSDVHVKGESSGAAERTRKIQGLNKNTDVTLKRGVVHMDSSFNQWIGRAKEPQKSREVVIDSFNEAGQKSSSMQLGGCVVVEYQGMPDLDGPANNATIEHMKLHCVSMKRASQ